MGTNTLETLSFAENVGRNGRQDSLQSLDLQDFTAFCDFIRATQSCRQGVDRPPSLALRRLVWVDRAECVVASLLLADFCVLGTVQTVQWPTFVVTRVCTFCTFVCSFSHNFVSQAGSGSSMSRRLNKIPTLSFKVYTAFGSPPWQVLIISAIPKGFLSSAAKVCACLFWMVGNNWDYSVYCAFLFVRFRDCVELFPTYFSVFPFSRVWLQTVSLRICVIFVSF